MSFIRKMGRGLTKRQLYKQPRPEARAKGAPFVGQVTEESLHKDEIVAAVYVLCGQVGLVAGRMLDYDPKEDQFTVICKDVALGKIVEAKVKGERAADLVKLGRFLNGGKPFRRPGVGL